MSGRGQWKSEWGFLFAAIGSAIGLGNIWRFSYMAYDNGGGAFLIPYLAALFTAGIPILLLEFAIGHERIGSAPLAFAKVRKGWEWLGWWPVNFVMFGIVLYYVVIISWCLNFFLLSFELSWGSDPKDFFFQKFLSLSSGPGEIGEIQTEILLGTVIIWLLNWFIVYRGVNRGIETANKIFMPLLLLLTVVMVFWSLSLEGASQGLKAYLKPDFSKLSNPKVWIDAYSQIFFTLSVGFGIMIAYASYLPRKANLTRYAFMTAIINCGFSLFAGIATFSVLGYMAAEEGKAISEVVSQSIGLAFVTYPKALSLMPGGNIFGSIFFFCLVIAGLSSSVSIIEAFVSAIIDKFGYKRKKVITVVSVIGFMGSIMFTTQGGLYFLDIVDHFLTHYGLVLVGMLQCVLIGWLYKLDYVRKHVNDVSSIHIGIWWNFLIKIFIPLILFIMICWDINHELQKPYGDYPTSSLILLGWNWLAGTALIAVIIATRPWKTAELDNN